MDTITVTVLRAGWWLPGRALAQGETIALDAATAEALARRGIVRLPSASADPATQVAPGVASNASKPARKRRVKED